jgi:hypothetical protein
VVIIALYVLYLRSFRTVLHCLCASYNSQPWPDVSIDRFAPMEAAACKGDAEQSDSMRPIRFSVSDESVVSKIM